MPVERQTASLAQVVGVDFYNQTTTGGVAKTLNAIRGDADHVPVVLIFYEQEERETDSGTE